MSSKSDGRSRLEDVLTLFPYDTPRDAQIDGMETLRDVADDNGFLLLEGACGTGKTILALAPLLDAVRSQATDYERVLVITSVKQQRWAFREAVKDINDSLGDDDSPVSALMLSGKADVTPYVRQGLIDPRDVYDEMEVLRENTRELIDQRSGENLEDKRSAARTLYGRAEVSSGEYPYGDDDIPYIERDGETMEYDPYYARHLAALYTREMEDGSINDEHVVPFDPNHAGVITPDTLVDLAGKREGTSPHSVMGDLLTDVDVVIGNYNHVFDPRTTERFTDDILDDDTLLVIDEAHNLVPDVRDLLGYHTSFMGLDGAATEIEEVLGWITGDAGVSGAVTARAQDLYTGTSVTTSEMEDTANLLRAIHDRLGERIDRFIEEEQGTDWWKNSEFDDLQMWLRDPETMGEDMLSQWLSMHPDLSKSTAKDAGEILDKIYQIRQRVYEEQYGQKRLPNSSLNSVGTVITNWVDNDNTSYFRQITLEERGYDPNDERVEFDWQNYYRATVEVKNCIPRDEISDRLDVFGAGVLMSATLKPFDVFEQVSGIDLLEENGRALTRRRYGLPFPEENRTSLAASATDFRYNNRGSAFTKYGAPNLDNEVRKEYKDALIALVDTTPGNVLIAMPSYPEAEWAGKVIMRESDTVEANHVLVDESSTDQETEQRKQEFFKQDGHNRVLVTGAHGTLIEGVDYDDDKLLGVAVCGVPLQSTHEPYQQAIQTAYEARFGKDNGFEYAFSLPAVYKARQTLGRVIRSDADLGARLLVDERYTNEDMWGSVTHLFPDEELGEFKEVEPDTIENRIQAFWKFHDN